MSVFEGIMDLVITGMAVNTRTLQRSFNKP